MRNQVHMQRKNSNIYATNKNALSNTFSNNVRERGHIRVDEMYVLILCRCSINTNKCLYKKKQYKYRDESTQKDVL